MQQNNIPCLVISLHTAKERRQHIIQEFGKQRIEFTFFDAITPDLIGSTCQKLGIDLINNQRLSQGEKACFLSHLSLWQKMIDENLDYLAIFEDDVYLGKDMKHFFQDKEWLSGIDLIKLEMFDKKMRIFKSNAKYINNHTIHTIKSTHLGAAGYILSQKMAVQLLNFIKSQDAKTLYAVDHILFEKPNNLIVHQINPALCIQADRYALFYDRTKSIDSQLENERFAFRQASLKPVQKLTPPQKIMREIKRPFFQLYNFIKNIGYYIEMEFK